jgi:diguanylate cyclase
VVDSDIAADRRGQQWFAPWFAPWLALTWRRIVGALALFTAVSTVAFVVSIGTVDRGPDDYQALWDGWVYHTVSALTAALVLIRVLSRAERRTMWICFGAGLAIWTVASLVYTFHDQHLDPYPVPPWSDLVYYAGYPFMFVGLALGTRANGRLSRSGWLDGLVVGLGLASAAGTLLLRPILANDEATPTEVFWSLGYPILDLVLVALVLAAATPRGWRVGASGATLSAGLAIYAGTDVWYSVAVAEGGYVSGTLIDGGWLAGMFVIAVASLTRDSDDRATGDKTGSVMLPTIFAIVALTVVVLDVVYPVPAPAQLFAGLCLALALARTVLAVRDVRRLHDSHRQARTDDLTGLPNRRALIEHVEHRLAAGEPTTLVLLDLDGFKEVNDSLGHESGDQLLREVADRLDAAAGDTVFVARLGGDEFGLCCAADAAAAIELARRASDALRAPFTLDTVTVRVGGSFGVAAAPDHATTTVGLMKFADIAMYRAKRQQLAIALYETTEESTGLNRLTLIEDLRHAIDERSLTLHFQPIVETESRRVIGAEALARWRHPVHGAIGPDVFVELAEQVGLMPQLTRSVLHQAITQAASWQAAGHDLTVNVNISATDLVDDGLADEITRLLREHRLDGDRLTLEITEQSIVADSERARRAIERLRVEGIRIAVDDFGVGYSSMSQLLSLPIDEVKIDRSFVSRLVGDDRARAIVSATVQLARALGADIVGEGVEDEAILDALAALGCDRVQGYLFARPMPADEFATTLRHPVTV